MQLTKHYKAYIFDFDGVVKDSVSVKTDAFAELYRPYGKDIEQAVVQYHLEHGGVSRYEKFRHYHNNLLNKPITEAEVDQLADAFNKLVFNKVIQSDYIEGVKAFIEDSFLTKTLIICTGTPEKEIVQILKMLDLSKFFHFVYGSPNTKTQIIENYIFKKFVPQELVFFGDAMTDYNAATATNVDFIGIGDLHQHPFPVGTVVYPNFHPNK